MRAKFYLGPRDGAEEEVQTSNGFAPNLYQHRVALDFGPIKKLEDALKVRQTIAYYDLQEVREGIAYYKYRCTA